MAARFTFEIREGHHHDTERHWEMQATTRIMKLAWHGSPIVKPKTTSCNGVLSACSQRFARPALESTNTDTLLQLCQILCYCTQILCCALSLSLPLSLSLSQTNKLTKQIHALRYCLPCALSRAASHRIWTALSSLPTAPAISRLLVRHATYLARHRGVSRHEDIKRIFIES
jgi:hypothetical protein